MSKVIACVIARTNSTRLPLKVLRDSGFGYSILTLLIKRLKSVKSIDEIFICTSQESSDDILEDVAIQQNVKIYRGSPDQVIERMLSVSELTEADVLLRITGDNPFTSVEYIDEQVKFLCDKRLDYVRVIDIPLGATAEVMTTQALKRCYEKMDPSVSEYLMLFMFDPDEFRCGVLRVLNGDYSSFSLTVDTSDDYLRQRLVSKHFENYREKPENISLRLLVNFFEEKIDLPARQIQSSGTIKLPYGKEISFDDFKADLKSRANNSDQLNLV